MYDMYYNIIIDDIFNNCIYNLHILFIMNNYYDIYENFNYIIKKKNINVYVLNDDKLICDKLLNDIKGEECERLIKIYNNKNDFIEYKNINNIILNNIIIFHLYSIEYLNNIILFCNIISNNNTIIDIYCSLSNNNKKIIYKNYIRTKLNIILKYKMGNVLLLSDVINNIENNNLKIKSINIFKKSNYVIYGDNTVYKITCYYLYNF